MEVLLSNTPFIHRKQGVLIEEQQDPGATEECHYCCRLQTPSSASTDEGDTHNRRLKPINCQDFRCANRFLPRKHTALALSISIEKSREKLAFVGIANNVVSTIHRYSVSESRGKATSTLNACSSCLAAIQPSVIAYEPAPGPCAPRYLPPIVSGEYRE